MKRLEELTPEDMRALKPGDEFVTNAPIGPDYRHFNVDTTIVEGGGNSINVVLLQQRPHDLHMVGIISSTDGVSFQAMTSRTEMKTALFQVASLGITAENAAELARGLLDQLDQLAPELAEAAVASFAELKAARQKSAQ